MRHPCEWFLWMLYGKIGCTGWMRKDSGWGNHMTYCGMECCKDCDKLPKCGGCEKCNGHPFGGSCIAERNREFGKLKQQLITEINALGIHGLHVEELYLLSGAYVNLEYPLANGYSVKFLKDQDIYLGNQVERPGSERCYGVVAEETFLLVCEYGRHGERPELVMFRRRGLAE